MDEPLFTLGRDETEYRLLTRDGVALSEFENRPVVKIESRVLTLLAENAFRDVNHFLRPSTLERLADVFGDPESSDNDKIVASELLRNAAIAAEGEYPLCQDTGTAAVFGWKGGQVWTDGRDEESLVRGIGQAYARNNFRFSQYAPLSMNDERNTGTNLPAQVEIYADDGPQYTFLMIAKGGGSSSRTFLYQETKAVLDPVRLPVFLTEKIIAVGTAACPPYHLAVVVGGLSPEMTLRTVKLAAAGFLDGLPSAGDAAGRAFRNHDLERVLLREARQSGLGAQFGGKYFCLDVRVIRLPRHGASCPIGVGVSCNAHRQIKARIDQDGVFLERLEERPGRFLRPFSAAPAVPFDVDRPMAAIRNDLGRFPIGTRLSLTGKLIVARDAAHARIGERLAAGGGLPEYFMDHVIYYAGPAKTPPGRASGSFGPTTAGRMDFYLPLFQAAGGSLVTLAKGNRSPAVVDSCRRFGGFYLGSIGGAAARLGRDGITAVEVLDYPDLGMEAVRRITVRDFPAFLLIDDKGNDFFGAANPGARPAGPGA